MQKGCCNVNIVYKRLEELTPYEKNPRKNDEAVKYVAQSIEEFGFKVPLVIDTNGVIVAGHTRYKAAQELAIEKVPCIVADDLTDEQIKAFRLADNKVSEFSTWDFALLTDELDELLDFDMEQFGFENIGDEVDVDLGDFFEPAEQKEKEPKKVQCPHCGEWFEV